MAIKTFWLPGAAALILAGCNEPAGEPDARDATPTENSEPQTLTPVDAAPEIEQPALGPISRAEIEAELMSGAGCSVEDDGKALLVAVDEDAIAEPYGTLRHFRFEGETGEFSEGGVFVAGAISVTVEPADVEAEQVAEEAFSRPARITMREEGLSEDFVLEASWVCGS